MDYTAAVFPISNIDPTIDVKKLAHVFLSEADKFNYDLCASIPILCCSTSYQLSHNFQMTRRRRADCIAAGRPDFGRKEKRS